MSFSLGSSCPFLIRPTKSVSTEVYYYTHCTGLLLQPLLGLKATVKGYSH